MNDFDKAIEIARNGKRGELALTWKAEKSDAIRIGTYIDEDGGRPPVQAFRYYLQLASKDYTDQIIIRAVQYAQVDVIKGKDLLGCGLVDHTPAIPPVKE